MSKRIERMNLTFDVCYLKVSDSSPQTVAARPTTYV